MSYEADAKAMQCLHNAFNLITKFKKNIENRPELAGSLAAPKHLFGPFSRYAVAPVYTRFDSIQWFVWDAETSHDGKDPDVIRQADTLLEAISGL